MTERMWWHAMIVAHIIGVSDAGWEGFQGSGYFIPSYHLHLLACFGGP